MGARARLGDVVGALNGWPEFRGRLWQRNYFEHVIRNETALDDIRRCSEDNPACWELDDENPRKIRP